MSSVDLLKKYNNIKEMLGYIEVEIAPKFMKTLKLIVENKSCYKVTNCCDCILSGIADNYDFDICFNKYKQKQIYKMLKKIYGDKEDE